MSVSEKYSTLYNRQKLFYLEHITRELPYRLTALDRLREGIKDNEQALAEALYKDLGKSQFESYATEIGILLNEIRYMHSHLRDWVADRQVFYLWLSLALAVASTTSRVVWYSSSLLGTIPCSSPLLPSLGLSRQAIVLSSSPHRVLLAPLL